MAPWSNVVNKLKLSKPTLAAICKILISWAFLIWFFELNSNWSTLGHVWSLTQVPVMFYFCRSGETTHTNTYSKLNDHKHMASNMWFNEWVTFGYHSSYSWLNLSWSCLISCNLNAMSSPVKGHAGKRELSIALVRPFIMALWRNVNRFNKCQVNCLTETKFQVTFNLCLIVTIKMQASKTQI